VLDEAALHGPAGEFVHLVGPQTEADAAALLIQFLVAAGNLAGKTHCRAPDGKPHYLNLFALIAVNSSKSRKGSSLADVLAFFELVNLEWTDKNTTSGLSSGEGLIWAVRDPISKREKNKDGIYKEVQSDPGVEDKRLLVTETEFASVLKRMTQYSNTLSTILRQAWDSGNLRTLTKNSPAKATGAHVSVCAHITIEELLRYFDATEAANGFGNRFLVVCARRSKLLPRGGRVDEGKLQELAQKVATALEATRKATELEFNEDAYKVWDRLYPVLSAERPGLLGSMLARSEAQVSRLAFVYAVLDGSAKVEPEHLAAAVALWEYCEESVEYIFGDRLGDPVADTILTAVRGKAAGLTRTQIRDLFARNQHAGRIDLALQNLMRANLVERQTRATPGRPAEVWTAKVTTKTTKDGPKADA
jgi:hypothetical protein